MELPQFRCPVGPGGLRSSIQPGSCLAAFRLPSRQMKPRGLGWVFGSFPLQPPHALQPVHQDSGSICSVLGRASGDGEGTEASETQPWFPAAPPPPAPRAYCLLDKSD